MAKAENKAKKPVLSSSLVEMVTMPFLGKILKSAEDGIRDEVIPEFEKEQKADRVGDRFNDLWKSTQSGTGRDLMKILLLIASDKIFWLLFCTSCFALVKILIPLLIQQFILVLEGSKALIENPYLIAGLLFVVGLVTAFSLADEVYYSRSEQVFKAVLSCAIFKKTTRLSLESRLIYNDAKILNLIDQDVDMATMVLLTVRMIPHGLQIAIQFMLLFIFLGYAAFASLAVILVSVGITMSCSPKTASLIKTYRENSTARVSVIRELLQAIRIVKYHVLEKTFEAKINEKREIQSTSAKHLMYLYSMLNGMVYFAPVLAPLVGLLVYSTYNDISASLVFPVLLLSDCSLALDYVQAGIKYYAISKTPLDDIAQFLKASEAEEPRDSIRNSSHDSIICKNATLGYTAGSQAFQLRDVSFTIETGAFVGIYGKSGSGKSTLLKGLIDQVVHKAGKIQTYGKVAYCSQETWLMAGSVKDNIIFGLEYDSAKMKNVIDVCCLEKDLALFPNGIDTVMGEKQLSGGQRARLSLARAVYSNRDVYLIDDVLSSSDSKTAAQLLSNLRIALKGKTVLLVTHFKHIIDQLDFVLLLADGNVEKTVRIDSLDTLELLSSQDLSDLPTSADTITSDSKSKDEKVEDLEIKEEKQKGFGLQLLYEYITEFGLLYSILLAIISLLTVSCYVGSYFSLTAWTTSLRSDIFWKIYLGLCILGCIFVIFSNAIVGIGCNLAANRIHNQAIKGIINSKSYFIESTPVGRIINRMTADVNAIDIALAYKATFFVSSLGFACSTVVIILIVFPYSAFIFVLAFAIALMVYKFYRKAYVEISRLTAISKSPVSAIFNETLNGTATITTYEKEDFILEKFLSKVDSWVELQFLPSTITYWYKQRLTLICAVISLAISIGGCIGPRANPEFAASIALAFSVSSSLVEHIGKQYGVNLDTLFAMSMQIESSMVAVERLDYYKSNLPIEAARKLDSDPSTQDWPTKGAIEIENLTLAYEQRPNYDVIKNLTISIKPGEKIGICGRTGSGKSSLVSALFRLMEAKSGTVRIDGVNIADLGLNTLRSSLQIIPQDPVLFQGTLRSNLGGDRFTDDELWSALELTEMKGFISQLELKLDSLVEIGGSNFSFGQRQLLILTAALLAKPKILIMDEATASIDCESDEKLQEMIKSLFFNTTVISVAHRTQSVSDYDRIVVLDQGRVIEFDTPSNLLLDPNSAFSKLASNKA